MTNNWKTKISSFNEKESIIRGYNHKEMIEKLNFTQSIYLILKGELPSEKQTKMLDAILVSSIDHGIEPSSATVARSVASTGNDLHTAVATGIQTFGKYHGAAIEDCAKILESDDEAKDIVERSLKEKKRLMGFGHKVYKDFDPRTKQLIEIAKDLDVFGDNCKKALDIEKELEGQKGKKLVLNVDGCIAAIILDLGFDSNLANAFFIISRTVGLCSHVHEELTLEKPVRRLEESEYIGERNKKL